MAKLPKISEAEWEVMEVVWGSSPITAGEIIDELVPRSRWTHRTIRTMLSRLVNKGALAFKEQGNKYLYRPRVKRQSYVQQESRSFVERVFCGDAASLLAHFVENAGLSPQEIENLKQVLDQQTRTSGRRSPEAK